jgi:5-methylcytosine-specific restriction endonuclease McrA
MFRQGEIISYPAMCQEEGTSLQRGMNYRLGNRHTVILMSVRPGAPYADRVEDEGRVLIYEGHDMPRRKDGPDPKSVDQPTHSPSGRLTQNGLFVRSVDKYKRGEAEPELARVYEKIRSGIWVYCGLFELVDVWQERVNQRRVFKFKLRIARHAAEDPRREPYDLEHDRVIPSSVKQNVWKRDKGRCVKCGRTDNLHFDHVIPYSKGGSSLVAENIQLLCARHNLGKRDRIE